MSQKDVERFVDCLSRAGYLQQQPISGKTYWSVTLSGSTVAHASAAEPLHRRVAERKLEEFLERVRSANRDPYYLYKITCAVLFGGMLTGTKRVSDIDVAVEIQPKHDQETQQSLNSARIAQALENGRRFSNIVERLFWPQAEVRRFLKSRSRAISLHNISDGILKTAPTKTIYEE